MKKIVLLSVFALSFLSAAGYDSFVKYKAGYGIFSLGEATAHLKIDENGSYVSEIKIKATGVAKSLSSRTEALYRSTGKVIEGKLVPESFFKLRESNSKKRQATYLFDHENKLVGYEEERCVNKECAYKSEMLPAEEYSQDDIISLYHNTAFAFAAHGAYEFNASAVGSKKSVSIVIPKNKQLKIAESEFKNTSGTYLLVILNQEIFGSSNGELYMNLESDMTVSKAVLQDTLLFGDIWGEQIEKKIIGEFKGAK